jgi:DNA-binding MarR family transcriptional regulator
MNQKSGAARSLSAQGFTEKQGQYLAFIYTYSHMFRRPPAETDMQRHFQVSPPSVHQMIVTLERNGFIRRQPGVARSIQIMVAPEDLPILDWLKLNYPRLEGEGFKWGRFEIDHRPRGQAPPLAH